MYADYLNDRSAIERNALHRLRELNHLTDGRRLLEVGCAAGFFLAVARTAGWSVHGLEFSDYMGHYARSKLGLDVVTGSIEAPPSGLAPADVVALWDTIEHLAQPARALRNIQKLLKPGGILVLSTGDYGSLLRRVVGRKWRLFGDPTHNFFFDELTLRKLLTGARFETIQVSRRGKWVSASMILHQCGLPFAARLRKALEKRGWNPDFHVNLRDVMTVYARVSE